MKCLVCDLDSGCLCEAYYGRRIGFPMNKMDESRASQGRADRTTDCKSQPSSPDRPRDETQEEPCS